MHSMLSRHVSVLSATRTMVMPKETQSGSTASAATHDKPNTRLQLLPMENVAIALDTNA